MAAQVTITVSPAGDTKIEVSGAPGTQCQELTKALERAIGSTTQSTPTSEMYRSAGANKPQDRELPA